MRYLAATGIGLDSAMGFAASTVADAAFASTALEGTPFSGRNLDVLWLAGYLLMAAAASCRRP